MTEKQFDVIAEDMTVSIKNNQTGQYIFNLACESIDDFDTLIEECMNCANSLNELSEENKKLGMITDLFSDRALKRLKEENAEYRRYNQHIAITLQKYYEWVSEKYKDTFVGNCCIGLLKDIARELGVDLK